MRERISQLAKGIVDMEASVIVLNPSTIEETISPGELKQGEFKIDSQNRLSIRGLVYSSNVRVKVRTDAFSGLRNCINFEVDSDYLEHGDEIKGSFYLVTNSGEREIPYSFRIEAEQSEQTLKQLETTVQFAQLAKMDMDTAIRLFEYSEFTEAPFMQDIHVRTLYDGLRGHGNRYHQLEEFLVALKVKEAVCVTVQETKKGYEYPQKLLEDFITLEKNTWGYLSIQIQTDGDFIQLNKKVIGNSDFKNNSYQIPYQINPARLHSGRNFGYIILIISGMPVKIAIEVSGDDTSLDLKEENIFNKRDFEQYIKFRLAYQNQLHDRSRLIGRMLIQIEKLRLKDSRNSLLALCHAELHLLRGQVDKAIPILEDQRAGILAQRQEDKEQYCFYQYLMLQAVPDESQQQSFLRLLYQYREMKQIKGIVLLLILKLDPDFCDDQEYSLIQLKKIFRGGCFSPFLYAETCRIWNHNPEFLQELEDFEIQAVNYGAKRGLLSQDLSIIISKVLSTAKRSQKLFFRILVNLYGNYQEKEILTAICSLLIRENCQSRDAFAWYEKALNAEVSLTRLYEYFLYSLPGDYKKLIPKEVLLYFSYDHHLDVQSKSVLYHNILMYMAKDEILYKQYEREISKFATEQLLNVRMNSRLAVIYDRMIYKDMIDLAMAKIFPAMLKANCLICNNPLMKYVVICYEELIDEEVYSLSEGMAYIPLFSSKCRILFQDAYGNRYSNVSFIKNRILVKPELELKCFEIYPLHPMLLLQACQEIIKKELLQEKDILVLERGLTELKLHPFFIHLLQARILDFFTNQIDDENEKTNSSYLLRVEPHGLSRKERNLICECLIANHYLKESYQMIQEYGWEGISKTRLLKLADKLILQQLFDQDQWLVSMVSYLFGENIYDRVVLDYLCEYFNGSSKQMYQILRQSQNDHVETYDLEERLLAQMLFTNHKDMIDQVFDWYVTKKQTSEKVIKAFFTMKSAEYVLDNDQTKERVFSYLESTIQKMLKKDKIPTIFLLALSKFYSTLPSLDNVQKELCENLMRLLTAQGIVMSYMKNLEKHIVIPDDIADKAIIQYHGKKSSVIDLRVRVLPQEEEYHPVSIRRMYQGIFVKQIVLFEGELIEYQIYEQQDKENVLIEEGSTTCELSSKGQKEGRFADLNQMGLFLTVKEDAKLKYAMQEYIIRDTAMGELFGLL